MLFIRVANDDSLNGLFKVVNAGKTAAIRTRVWRA